MKTFLLLFPIGCCSALALGPFTHSDPGACSVFTYNSASGESAFTAMNYSVMNLFILGSGSATTNLTNSAVTKMITPLVAPTPVNNGTITASISMSGVTNITGGFLCWGHNAITNVAFPNLVSIGGQLGVYDDPNIVGFDFHNLQNVGTTVQLSSMKKVTNVNLGSLTNVGADFNLGETGPLLTINLSNLISTGNLMNFSTLTNCTNINLSSLVTLGKGGAGNIFLYSMPSLVHFSTPALKAFTGNWNATNGVFDAASINGMLATLVAATNYLGQPWGNGWKCQLEGGSNAAPTGQGTNDVATLQARGVTVTTN